MFPLSFPEGRYFIVMNSLHRGDSLPERDPAVIRRHQMVDQDLEILFFQAFFADPDVDGDLDGRAVEDGDALPLSFLVCLRPS